MTWASALAATLLLTAQANDTNEWLHIGSFGYQVGTNWFTELPHRQRWHDGFYGPEIVRMEVVTNEVIMVETNAVMHIAKLRMLRVIANGRTNDVVLQELGGEIAPTTPAVPQQCGCACCSSKLPGNGFTNNIFHLLPNGSIDLSTNLHYTPFTMPAWSTTYDGDYTGSVHLTNFGVLPAKINGVDVLIPLTK